MLPWDPGCGWDTKIKAVGDAYMAAGGLPAHRSDHLEQVADLALEMQQIAREMGVRMRVGICTGELVAGVIGTRKYLYDLRGDTVNTASRLESHSLPGRIQVTEETACRLAEDYDLEERGEIEMKGLGRVRTYFLLRKKAHLTATERARARGEETL